MAKFWDKFGDNATHASIEGDKSKLTINLTLDEGKIYRDEKKECFVIAGNFSNFGSLPRQFPNGKPEEIEPQYATIHIFRATHKIKKYKGKGIPMEYLDCKASTTESLLYDYIKENLDTLQPEGKHIKGQISLLGSDILDVMGKAVLEDYGKTRFKVEPIDPSSDWIEWKPWTGGSKKKSQAGASPEEKMAFVRKHLIEGLNPTKDDTYDKLPLAELVAASGEIFPNEAHFVAYIDLISSCLS